MEQLDDRLLEAYMTTFYGYGNYKGRYWFVGMEEGGGNSTEEVIGRLVAWVDGGKAELRDLSGYQRGIGASRYFGQRPRIQRTWGGLIKLLLASKGLPAGREEVRAYQRDQLGSSNGETCLLELLPLPSPSTGHWQYKVWSSLPQLRTREIYGNHYAPIRAEHLKKNLAEHTPACVVFYGVHPWYMQWWQLIAGIEFERVTLDAGRFYIGRDQHTVFVTIKHPSARMKSTYLLEVAKAFTASGIVGRSV